MKLLTFTQLLTELNWNVIIIDKQIWLNWKLTWSRHWIHTWTRLHWNYFNYFTLRKYLLLFTGLQYNWLVWQVNSKSMSMKMTTCQFPWSTYPTVESMMSGGPISSAPISMLGLQTNKQDISNRKFRNNKYLVIK